MADLQVNNSAKAAGTPKRIAVKGASNTLYMVSYAVVKSDSTPTLTTVWNAIYTTNFNTATSFLTTKSTVTTFDTTFDTLRSTSNDTTTTFATSRATGTSGSTSSSTTTTFDTSNETTTTFSTSASTTTTFATSNLTTTTYNTSKATTTTFNTSKSTTTTFATSKSTTTTYNTSRATAYANYTPYYYTYPTYYWYYSTLPSGVISWADAFIALWPEGDNGGSASSYTTGGYTYEKGPLAESGFQPAVKSTPSFYFYYYQVRRKNAGTYNTVFATSNATTKIGRASCRERV